MKNQIQFNFISLVAVLILLPKFAAGDCTMFNSDRAFDTSQARVAIVEMPDGVKFELTTDSTENLLLDYEKVFSTEESRRLASVLLARAKNGKILRRATFAGFTFLTLGLAHVVSRMADAYKKDIDNRLKSVFQDFIESLPELDDRDRPAPKSDQDRIQEFYAAAGHTDPYGPYVEPPPRLYIPDFLFGGVITKLEGMGAEIIVRVSD